MLLIYLTFFYIIYLHYFIKKMQGYVVFLIFIFIVGQILIINFIRNKFTNKNKTGKIKPNNILEAELDLDRIKDEAMLESRRFLIKINGIGI